MANVIIIAAGYYTYGVMLVLIVLLLLENVKSERLIHVHPGSYLSQSLSRVSTRLIETSVMSVERFALDASANE